MTDQAPPASPDDFWAKWITKHGSTAIDEVLRGEMQRLRVKFTGDSTAPPYEYLTWLHAKDAGYQAAGVDMDALARVDLEALTFLARDGALASVLALDLWTREEIDYLTKDDVKGGAMVGSLAAMARSWRRLALREVCDRAPRPELRLVEDVHPEAPGS